ncbi:tyrosine-protein kinase receptor Tie-1-like [Patiria miniata]|uniref:receptor protein-tyrosine kinase n=1 Tax=Patiria miniata TaxID=46514 RepID=A0A914ASV7_PATMI|nr:tyrosine-protein kinase receptor Tie-1-like [Patiria miniata]
MVTPTPYGAGSSQSSASISCFRSSPDSSTTVSFGRPFQIGLGGSSIQTSTTLPTGSSQSVNGQIVTQYLTTSNDATGLFYCEGSNRGLTTRVYSIIHSVNRRFEPVDGLVTKTINKGEDVTLSVITVNSGGSPIWRQIRNGTVVSDFPSYNQPSFTLPSADAVDGDLYTVIGSDVTLNDNHFSMIRLIVRGCVAGKWGPPDCGGVCDLCYNGGVCDDETGDCICPPGFSGPNCLTVCGMHIFGWSCEFQCGPTGSNVIQSCTGSQFGLPDPYGNSCISGYKGTYCNIPCTLGTFGAGCSQSCHCQSGFCNVYTGACTGISGCAAGWSGTYCQIPDICPVGYYGVNCLSKCTCLNNAACDKNSGVCITSPCSSSPCSFGATCLDTGSSFTCLCPDERSGITCQYTSDFPIICTSGVHVIDTPGSTVDVIIAEPTVSDGTTGVTFSMRILPSNTYTAFQSQQQIVVPSSGSATVDIEVAAYTQSPNQYSYCAIRITVTAFQIACASDVPVYGTPGSIVSVTLPQPTISEGITDVAFYFLDQDNQQISICNNHYQVTAPVSGSQTVDVNVITNVPMNPQRSCTIPITITAFEITCATNIPVIDTPGSDVSVPIPLPTVSNGVIDVTFNFKDPENNSSKPLTSRTQYQANIPMSGSTTVDFQVFAFRPSSQQLACAIPITLRGLPYLSQPPSVTVTLTSATVSWQAWDPNVDAGDGPVFAYKVYYSLKSSISWTVAETVSVTNSSQALYSSTIPSLNPNTEYMFSVAAVLQEQGGEGPMSPVTIKVTSNEPEPATLSPTTTASTIAESGSPVEPTTQFNMIPPTTQPPRKTTVTNPPNQSLSSSALIAVIVVVVIVVIVVAAVLCVYFLRRRRSRRQPAKTPSAGGQEMTTYENQISPDNDTGASDYERVGQDHPTSYEVVGINMSPPTYEDVGLPSWGQGWSVPFKNMMIGDDILGEGNFGEVRDGAVKVGGKISKAAIKTLKANASENDRQNFMEEFRTLTKVGRHPNVVSILGACQHEDILYVALEFMPNGDLRTYLRNARSLGDNDQSTLSSEKLIQFALDVAKGMQHLDAVEVIHRDLAARNILLDNQLVAKVSDFGLSRGEDIYVQMSRTRVPTRWLSLESLASKTYTPKSDVWSFGILLWEIATLGATPYEDTKSKDLLSRLKSGYRMPKPSSCDDEFYNLMLLCWQEDPAHRPHFKNLVTRLTSMGDSQNEHTYMRLLPKADNYMYLMIRPELDDN